MLGADVVVEQAIGFFRRELQHALGFGAERDFDRGRDLLAEDRAAFDFLADVFEGQVRARENPAGQAFSFADQAKKQVLGLDRDASELACFVAGEEEHPPRSFGVPLEHPAAYVMKERSGTGTKPALAALYGKAGAPPIP